MAETTTNGGTDVTAVLPKDVLVEVFSRVQSVRDLFRCAMTCRRWLCLFTDQDFLRRLWPETGRARLLGLFLNRPMKKQLKQQRSSSALSFVPRPGSPLLSGDCVLASFDPGDHGLYNYVQPLASRGGVLFMRFFSRASDFVSRNFDVNSAAVLLLGLCNPITGAHEIAPPLECTCLGRYVNGYGIFTAADCDLRHREQRPSSARYSTTFSRLLVVGAHQQDHHLHLHSYSGATRSWSAPTKCLHTSRIRMVGTTTAVFHRGAAHWLYTDNETNPSTFTPQDERDNLYTLSVEAGTVASGGVIVTKLPAGVGARLPFLCVSRDNRLSIASVRAEHVVIWTQQDGDDADPAAWLRTQVIQVTEAMVGANIMRFDYRKWFHFSKGAMLALYEPGGVFVLDLQTKAIEKIMDLSQCFPVSQGYYSYLPYEMDLPEFFLSQLGALIKIINQFPQNG